MSKISGASASVAYAHEQWGDAFAVLVDHIPVGTTCQLWVVHPDGTRTQVAAWTAAADEGKVWYNGSMASTDKAISKFQITVGPQGPADHRARLSGTSPDRGRLAAGMDAAPPMLSIGVTAGLIALVVALAAASGLGLAMRRRAGRFRGGPAAAARPADGQNQRPARGPGC